VDIATPRAKANAIVASTSTIDGHFPQVEPIRIASAASNYCVVARRGSDAQILDPDLITVDAASVLYHYRRQPGAEEVWSQERLQLTGVPGPIVHIDAFSLTVADRDERVLAFVQGKRRGELAVAEHGPDGWRQLPLAVGQLAIEGPIRMVRYGEEWLFYGQPRTLEWRAEIGIATDSNGSWRAVMAQAPQSFDCLVALPGSGDLWSARAGDGSIALDSGTAQTIGDMRWLDLQFRSNIMRVVRGSRGQRRPGAGALRDFTDLDGTSRGLLVLGDDDLAIARWGAEPSWDAAVRLVEPRLDPLAGLPGSDQPRPVAPHGITEVAGSVAADGAFHVYARDRDGMIWHTRWLGDAGQDAADAIGVSWLATGHRANRIEAPQTVGGELKLFAVDEDGAVGLLSRPMDGLAWSYAPITLQGAETVATQANVHVVSLSSVTVASDPVPDTPIEIWSSAPVLVEQLGKLYRLTPGQRTPFRTDALGTITLRMIAKGLEAPDIHAALPELAGAGEAKFRPHEDALRRVSDPEFTTGESLIKAGLAPPEWRGEQADALAKVMREAAAAAYADDTYRNTRARFQALQPEEVGFSVLRTAGGPVGSAFVPQRSFATAFPSGADAAGSSFSLDATGSADATRFGAGTGDAFADFANFLHDAWHKVVEIAVHVVEEGVKLVVRTAQAIGEFVTNLARDIAKSVQALLAWLSRAAAAAKDAVDKAGKWLAEQLGWGDVIRCKRVMRDYLTTTLEDFERFVGAELPEMVSQGIQDLRGRAATLFDQGIANLTGKPLVPQTPPKDKSRSQFQEHGATLLTVHSATPRETNTAGTFAFSSSLARKLGAIQVQAEALGNNAALRDSLFELSDRLSKNPDVPTLLSLLAGEALRLAKPAVLIAIDLADVVQQLIFEAIAELLALLRKLLTSAVSGLGAPFRWVSSMYRSISGDELSILDLACLLFVTPGVLLFHLVQKTELLPEADVPQGRPVNFMAVVADLASAATRSSDMDEDRDGGDMAAPGNNAAAAKAVRAAFATLQHRPVRFWFDTIDRLLQICGPLNSFIRSMTAVEDNLARLAQLQGAPGKFRPLAIVNDIFDWVPRIFAVTQILLIGILSPARWPAKLRDDDGLVVKFAVFVCLAAGFSLFGLVIALTVKGCLEQYVGGPLVGAITSVISMLIGVGILVYTLYLISHWTALTVAGAKQSEREITQFWLGQAGSLAGAVQGLLALVLPIGSVALKAPPPVSVAGAAAMGAAIALDSGLHLAQSAISGMRIFV